MLFVAVVPLREPKSSELVPSLISFWVLNLYYAFEGVLVEGSLFLGGFLRWNYLYFLGGGACEGAVASLDDQNLVNRNEPSAFIFVLVFVTVVLIVPVFKKLDMHHGRCDSPVCP